MALAEQAPSYDLQRRKKLNHGFETTAVRRRGKSSRRRTFPGQHPGMASYQEHRGRRGGYQGRPLREDPGGAAGEHLPEIPQRPGEHHLQLRRVAEDRAGRFADSDPHPARRHRRLCGSDAGVRRTRGQRVLPGDDRGQHQRDWPGGGQRRPAAPLLPHLPVREPDARQRPHRRRHRPAAQRGGGHRPAVSGRL